MSQLHLRVAVKAPVVAPRRSRLGQSRLGQSRLGQSRPAEQRPGRTARRSAAVHLAVLAGFLAAGVAVTWPHATYLAGRLPAILDTGDYVWDFWWVAHAVEHFASPWSTGYLAAPVGAQLGYHTLMPLAGIVMLPVTALFGPSASYTLLSVAAPGLLGYATYRVARLWLSSPAGALAAGALFGLSPMLDRQSWVHLNLALGALFLPLTLEAAVRLRRRAGLRQAIILGLVLGASVLVDQESAVLATLLAAGALLPWLAAAPRLRKLPPLGVAALTALVVASPQIAAIAYETATGGPLPRPSVGEYRTGIGLSDMFAASPRVQNWGLNVPHSSGYATYGAVLTVLALSGLILAWRRPSSRRPSARLLALGWLAAAILALGSDLRIRGHNYTPLAHTWHGVQVSMVMPFTWLVSVPGFSGFRTPSRIAEVGLLPAALLAGFTVSWLRYHAMSALIGVVALGVLEAGSPAPPVPTMPTALPALDRPIAADRSGSIVVDVPFGLRGGVGITGRAFPPETEVLATADGHPLGDAYLSRIPSETANDIAGEPFYAGLMAIQRGAQLSATPLSATPLSAAPLSAAPLSVTPRLTAAQLALAAENARDMHVGWVVLWHNGPRMRAYLTAIGFRLAYQADGALVYRPAR